ncbi:MAG: tetratricopeptide repeat protein [Bacteroidales bacterium]
MKTIAKFLSTGLLVVLAITAFGQKGIEDGSKYGHGEDSVRCVINMSLYREYVKQGNFAPAIAPWQIVYNECPKATKYLYIDGVKMITDAIDKETDAANKKLLVDSLMKVYDNRIKYFGQLGYVLGRKGIDYNKYSENTPENLQVAYDFLKKSIETERAQSGPQELFTFMQVSADLFKAKTIEGNQVVADYALASDLIDQNLKKAAEPNMQKAKEAVDVIFENSGAASCDDLIPYYTQKFKETPEDKEFLKKAAGLLSATKCTKSDIYFSIIEKLYSLEPTLDVVYEFANLNRLNEKYDLASKLYIQAIDLQSDNLLKSRYYIELGDLTRKDGNYPLARTYALNAIENDPNSGVAYMLIGQIYTASSKSCSEDEFEQKTVFWAAVDKFAKAKSVDPNLTAQADELIATYKPHFPDNENIFFYGLKEGDSYTIKCWINETTTVRSR